MPVFGPLFTKLAISRWARNLGTLLAVGVPIIQALDVVGGTAGNAVVSEAMDDVQRRGAGRPADVAAAGEAVAVPDMVVQMIEVGEETGQITEMLDKVADYYDQEVETATESLTSAMEPLLVVLLGAVIGTMVICLYLPMFSIYQHIQTTEPWRPVLLREGRPSAARRSAARYPALHISHISHAESELLSKCDEAS